MKGGNVLDVVHKVSTRPSADLDFSIDGDFPDADAAKHKFERAIERTFASEALVAFDFRFRDVPPNLTEDRADFWGGYKIEFKLIEREKYDAVGGDVQKMRRAALAVGKVKSGSSASTKFGMDLSKYEYCAEKESKIIDGFNIFVYSPSMFVCEKVRAICQQMPEYVKFVGSHPSGRARDFVDIHTATEHFAVDFENTAFQTLVPKMFDVKKVSLTLIGQIADHREFHRDSFQSVQDTVKAGVELQDYDYYFDYVLDRCTSLESLWDK